MSSPVAPPRMSKDEILVLVARVGVSEAARQAGVPKGTVGRWAAEAKHGVKRNETPKRNAVDVEGTAAGASTQVVAPRARTPHPDVRLSDAQRIAIPLLLDARPTAELLAATGITREVLRAWHRDPVFAGILSELRAERRRLVLETVDAAIPEAVDLIRKVVSGHVFPPGCAPTKVMVTAAIAILDRGGLPKTERIEHARADTDPDADLDQMTPEELAAEEARLTATVALR